jgi:citrate lyase subunit beta/citryl-CoA lyase
MYSLNTVRRSVLYLPASNPRAVEKAKSLGADALIFDLEDAVAPDQKINARNAAIHAVNSGAYGRRELFIRINSMDSPWGAEDARAVVKSKADAVLVPKVSEPKDLALVEGMMRAHGKSGDLGLWAMMETAKGILAADTIAKSSKCLSGYCMGTADLSMELRCHHPADRTPMLMALQLVVIAARAHSMLVLDGVHVDITNIATFEAACRQGRSLGFDGKTLIHPDQIAIANKTFSPTSDELGHAKQVIKAYEEAIAKGKGITTLDGQLIERLHVEMARDLISRADVISSFENLD